MFKEIKDFIPGIHKEGYLIILIAVVVTLLLLSVSKLLGLVAIVLTVLSVCFFRDPERVSPESSSLILSPADGLVQQIEIVNPPQELELPNKKMQRISIFLSVFDVHVNRIPVKGKVIELRYQPGKFLNASFDKASEENERESIWLEATYEKTQIAVVQIAGLIARRIVCNLEEGQEVKGGERFGIIRFGSRVDLYIPQDIKVHVLKGQTVLGGETVIADLSKKELKKLTPVKKIPEKKESKKTTS